MGKIVLEFDAIEESHDAQTAINAMKWKMSIWDLDQKLRKITKYRESIIKPDQPASKVEHRIATKLRGEIQDILSNYGLNLED